MEWGIRHRTRGTLRLDALQRIAAIGRPEDLQRLLASVGSPDAGRALEPREAENLLALASAVGRCNGDVSRGTAEALQAAEPQLAALLVSSWSLATTGPSLGPAGTLNRRVARELTAYFASTNNNEVVTTFFSEFDRVWQSSAQESPAVLRAVFYAVLGYLEGLARARNAAVIGEKLVALIMRLCRPDFVETVQSELDSENAPVDLGRSADEPEGVIAVVHAVAEVLAFYAEANPAASLDTPWGAPARGFLVELIQFSEDQLDQLEDAYGFHTSANRAVTPLLGRAIDAHFRVLESLSSAVPVPRIWAAVSRSLSLLTPRHAPLAATLARLTAKLIGGNHDLLSAYFEPLLNFLVRLPPATSMQAVREFTAIYAPHLHIESNRMKLLYTLANKLSLAEYEIAATAGDGDETPALAFVASLLSIMVGVVTTLDRPEVVETAISVLEQKMATINPEVDARIIETWGLLAPHLPPAKFPAVLQQLVRCERKLDPPLVGAVKTARLSLAANPGRHSAALFAHLLDLVVMNDGSKEGPDVRNLLAPLALISGHDWTQLANDINSIGMDTGPSLADASGDLGDAEDEPTGPWQWLSKQRNAWFNLAALGITATSLKGDDLRHLRTFARNSPPLVSEESANHLESDLKINAVLCRGAASAVLQLQHQALASRGIRLSQSVAQSPVNTLFLSASLMIEDLRCHTGVISQLPHYFADADLSQIGGEGRGLMTQITEVLVAQYIRNWGYVPDHGLAAVAQNLKELLVLACHRVDAVRDVATALITQIVNAIPASLCQPTSLFAMFDCLTLLGRSTANAVEDEYSPRAVFYSPTSDIRLELSDNVVIRTASLRGFSRYVDEWLAIVNSVLSADLRSRLYSYLNRQSALGHGRRKALEFLSSEDASDDFVTHCVLLSRYESNAMNPDPTGLAHSAQLATDRVVEELKCAQDVAGIQHAFSLAGPFVSSEKNHYLEGTSSLRIVRESVAAPFRVFTEEAMTAGITFWYHIISHHPNLISLVIGEVVEHCILSAKKRQGLFSKARDVEQPLWSEMEYAPTNKKVLDREERLMRTQLAPHEKLLNGFLKSCMYNSVLLSPLYLPLFARLSEEWLKTLIAGQASLHSLARNLRLEVLSFSIDVLAFLWSTQNQTQHPFNREIARNLEGLIIRAGLSWYIQPTPQWSYGSSIPSQQKTLNLLHLLARFLNNRVNTLSEQSLSPSKQQLLAEEILLHQLVTQEHQKMAAWYEPLGPGTVDHLASSAQPVLSKINNGAIDTEDIKTAWRVHPHLAVSLNSGWRFKSGQAQLLLQSLVSSNPLEVWNYSTSIHLYLKDFNDQSNSRKHRNNSGPVNFMVLYWQQISPIESINLLLPPFCDDHATVQFALRSLLMHDISKTFFWVPQIVQQLRHDERGYIEWFILEAAKYSQKFAHQIIWNMKANMYLDDDATVPSPLKPKLDEVLKTMIASFTPEEKAFYDTEFSFFGDVTAISGELKPYIKKSKAEKKEKIDEEIRKIKVPEGAYLPSHPDGVVLDIDRDSGKPLQSHAKAPFLAKFKIRVNVEEVNAENVAEIETKSKDLWQGAIFKVGDDCRQDVLALQVISVFRSIFNYCGLDVYVFPYKVTATEAGRGVIDVLPNSVSRDMLGREAVNGLDQWFRSKHGGPNSIDFQRARLNFVKSMAAYSVISYLIQFKDRHNGNIMYDDDGHVIHIDFGFCFDIVPGGVKFEAAPFKLTKEMARLMGGNKALPFKWFEELCVRAFLASRVYVDDICRVVEPMLESGLPCFKGHTIKRLRDRFALNKNEADAAKFMRSLIHKSYESNFTKGYDEFQRLTNGIPY